MASSTDEDEGGSVLKIIWSIRELSELSFYVDYVHHLVKAQEQLLKDEEQGDFEFDLGESKDSPAHVRRKRKQRAVVEVEVFLTGLGSRSDPVYMLSQTLFLLSIAHTSSTYMKIHFGRPDIDKLVREFNPEEVYYCGGSALKTKLSDVCRDARITFHPEDFDAGGGDFVRAIYKGGVAVKKQWYKWFPGCKPAKPSERSASSKKENNK